jgi:hypothetical protein
MTALPGCGVNGIQSPSFRFGYDSRQNDKGRPKAALSDAASPLLTRRSVVVDDHLVAVVIDIPIKLRG